MLAIVASLVSVGLQIRQTPSIGEGAQAVAWMETAVSSRDVTASHSDVWIKGCLGQGLNAAEDAAFAQLFRACTQAKYFGWLSGRQGIIDTDPDVQAYTCAANIHRYPGFAGMIPSWRAMEPGPAFDAKWCGMQERSRE